MEEQDMHHRHILLYYFRKGKNAMQAHKKLCAVYGGGVITERQCQNWFAKFRCGNFSLKDVPRSGRRVEIDETLVKDIIETNRYIKIREIAEKLKISHKCTQRKLKELGYVKESGKWILPKVKEAEERHSTTRRIEQRSSNKLPRIIEL